MFDIFVDSGANIPSEIVARHDITVMQLNLTIDGKSIPSFVPDLTPEQERKKAHEYYQAIREGAVVNTSLVNSYEFEDAFRKSLEDGRDVLCFTMSANISGTYNAARLTTEDLREEFPDRKIYLIDSMNASLGEGILAIYAAEMRDAGKGIDEIYDYLSEMVHKMNGVFTVEDLKYIARTGRLSNTEALVGNLLGIKPLLKGSKDGWIVAFKKVRGRKKVLNDLADLFASNIENPEDQIVGIAHADAYEDSLYVMNRVLERIKVREFINTPYDYGTGSHVGPGTIAVFFVAKDRELEKSFDHD